MTYVVRKACFLLVILSSAIFFPQFVQAQSDFFSSADLSQVEVNELTNDQISAIYQKAIELGLSEKQVYQEASRRGMPPDQVADLRNRLSGYFAQSTVNNDLSSRPTGRYNPNLDSVPSQKVEVNNNIFGSELFTTTSLVFEPNLRIPPPSNYMLGPDDEIIISVYGYSEKKYSLTINELGEIYIPNVGPLFLSGLTLEQATDKIRDKLASTIYKAIRSGQTKVQVTLGKIRSIRVTVIGQAKRPGTYTVSSLTTLYNILYLCGGPTDMGSYRDIEVIRGNEKRTADLYDFLVYGNQKDNILLQEGDVVRIPYYENRVTLLGNVKRTGRYEMQDGETFQNLLKYSGGFTDNAYRGAVTVERITDSLRRIIDLNAADFATFGIKSSDKYYVGKLQDEFGNRIYISGAVLRPGPYELENGMTVKTLIAKAGGLARDAFSAKALLYRYFPNKLPAIQSVNLDSVLNFGETVYLKKNDSLVIHSIFYFRNNQTVSVRGNVRNPEQIRWRENLTLSDVIFAAGGIDEAGDSTTVEVSRRIPNASVEEANHLESRIFQIDLTQKNAGDLPLEPFDIVIVKEKPGYNTQRTVLVQGEVLRPGVYALPTSGARISDIIQKTGGFKASADSNSITIRRLIRPTMSGEEKKRIFQRILNFPNDSLSNDSMLREELNNTYDLVSVNLKDVLNNPEIPENLQLQDGDVLFVERTTNLVRVSGEVYFPTIVAYKPHKNLKYYVEQAGDFTPHSRKTASLVIQPNGKVKSVKSFLFFKFYPPVTNGSEIFVPQKDLRNKNKLTIGEWSVIASTLAIVANVIFNITK